MADEKKGWSLKGMLEAVDREVNGTDLRRLTWA